MNEYYAIGLMSGSSLDGLDIAYVHFKLENGNWQHTLLKSDAIPLGEWTSVLSKRYEVKDSDLPILDKAFGEFLGNCVNQFVQKFNISQIDLIASHGHTIYHFPERGITCQIGCGNEIASITGIQVVSNLRQADIDEGGSGAPIVPIADLLLYANYGFCLNIGGIANISLKKKDEVIAYDIAPANQILNHYAKQLGQEYDNSGNIAQSGERNTDLIQALFRLSYFSKAYPKSLDNSFSIEVIKLIDNYNLTPQDALSSYTHFLGQIIGSEVDRLNNQTEQSNKMLITGGGAKNTFLIESIKTACEVSVITPPLEIIDFKEAIAMALIGVLKHRNEINCLASVTGAKKNTVCGTIHYPKI